MISGLVCVRNAVVYDYCWREAVASLLPVVDEMLICDGQSTDGTREHIDAMAAGEPKIHVIEYPWPNPKNDPGFWVAWLNWARQHAKHPMLISLDADEVLDPEGYPRIREVAGLGGCAFFERLNFWKDARHLAPENRVCGTYVARLGPSSLYLPSDEPNAAVSPNIREKAKRYRELRIFHYGFIRNPEAFVKKSIGVQNMFFGSVDSRITEQAAKGLKWNDRNYFDNLPLRPYAGPHPEVAHAWLKERGHEL